jgi:hypothetical protein
MSTVLHSECLSTDLSCFNNPNKLRLDQYENTAVERADKKNRENKELYERYAREKKEAELKKEQDEEADSKMVNCWTN